MTQTAEQRDDFHVVERHGWFYVDGPRTSTGPWRYRWEAQEYADKLNAGTEK